MRPPTTVNGTMNPNRETLEDKVRRQRAVLRFGTGFAALLVDYYLSTSSMAKFRDHLLRQLDEKLETKKPPGDKPSDAPPTTAPPKPETKSESSAAG